MGRNCVHHKQRPFHHIIATAPKLTESISIFRGEMSSAIMLANTRLLKGCFVQSSRKIISETDFEKNRYQVVKRALTRQRFIDKLDACFAQKHAPFV
ncbi:MAG: hypothetical protein EA424_24170 [Planctomycetaceae bacterium]|nr:MAG: hypothetical protein EA424_24170 [Planctomycetaceae bacterium]